MDRFLHGGEPLGLLGGRPRGGIFLLSQADSTPMEPLSSDFSKRPEFSDSHRCDRGRAAILRALKRFAINIRETAPRRVRKLVKRNLLPWSAPETRRLLGRKFVHRGTAHSAGHSHAILRHTP